MLAQARVHRVTALLTLGGAEAGAHEIIRRNALTNFDLQAVQAVRASERGQKRSASGSAILVRTFGARAWEGAANERMQLKHTSE